MAKRETPGEAGGRRKIGRDRGSPKTGDGRTVGRPIGGDQVVFRTSGGREVGSGGLAGIIRRITGKHRSE